MLVTVVLAVGLVGCGSGISEEDLAAVRSEAADAEASLRDLLDEAASEAEAAAEAASEAADSAADRLSGLESELADAEGAIVVAESERDAAVADLEPQEVLADRASELDDLAADLDARANGLEERASELEAREAAVSGTEAAIAASTFGNGTFIVGQDIPAGRYRSDGTGNGCYWERNTADGDGIIDNHFGSSPAVATVRDGEIFRTEDCGTWSPA
ncbi:hypothetical protein [Euzebya rosea]|uniref:hypothetical protein n=1 Tax=Euzebya rosea TaxID=2052804 RepID=UPI000D3E1C77|nr:hypothetical protein [Euzebya rosea]